MSAMPDPSDVSSDAESLALGPVDFATHILSLASSAMIALGKMPSPDAGGLAPDLDAARHLIDVLGVLQDKTRGNLDESETRLLQSLLYDLRVSYVDAQAGKTGP
jgi:hypothetical protein